MIISARYSPHHPPGAITIDQAVVMKRERRSQKWYNGNVLATPLIASASTSIICRNTGALYHSSTLAGSNPRSINSPDSDNSRWQKDCRNYSARAHPARAAFYNPLIVIVAPFLCAKRMTPYLRRVPLPSRVDECRGCIRKAIRPAAQTGTSNAR